MAQLETLGHQTIILITIRLILSKRRQLSERICVIHEYYRLFLELSDSFIPKQLLCGSDRELLTLAQQAGRARGQLKKGIGEQKADPSF
jgi:hypothetical protein